jgi:cupin superfamily acireductone dioxygenase involved in methionine salvage
MLFSNNFYQVFDSLQRPSVYVISDSQLAEYKAKQAQAEIAELDRLIDGHKQSIERLEKTKSLLTEDVERISPSESPQKSLQELGLPE